MQLRRVSERAVTGLLADPSKIERFLFPSQMETAIDHDTEISIGEAFRYLALLHFRHVDPPLAVLTTGGAAIGDFDTGEGPARGFTAAEVRKLAAKLATISRDDVVKELATVPLPPRAPTITELGASYHTLREFVIGTAKAEAGMIVYVVRD